MKENPRAGQRLHKGACIGAIGCILLLLYTSGPQKRRWIEPAFVDAPEEALKVAKVNTETVEVKNRSTSTAGSRCEWEPASGGEDNRYPGFCEGLLTVKGNSSDQCKELCCESKECDGWQYREDLGCRHATRKNRGWCEPTAPSPWKGHKIATRRPNGECVWEEKVQQSQCKGLGPRRPVNGEPWKTPEQCAKECCSVKSCVMYQFREDKGCFWGKANYCDTDQGPHAWKPFKGGRKLK
uniref:Uncharacterized protein n=1 Tax=Lotharella globosa TaxID=91324 RepID=A0A7S4DW13_9EUKA|mmetsp:Transcript_4859/g.8791  ORF Transcript_4859/g.8791 Transcript_4859/m.8791 type:complete len:239 (+) Transcript_4859:47-763(+)